MELQKLYSKVRYLWRKGQSDTLVCTGWNAKILSEEI